MMLKKLKHFIIILITSWMIGISNIIRDEEKMVADFIFPEAIVEIYNVKPVLTYNKIMEMMDVNYDLKSEPKNLNNKFYVGKEVFEIA